MEHLVQYSHFLPQYIFTVIGNEEGQVCVTLYHRHLQHFSWPNANSEATKSAPLNKFRGFPLVCMLTQVPNNACANNYITRFVVVAILRLSLWDTLSCHSFIYLASSCCFTLPGPLSYGTQVLYHRALNMHSHSETALCKGFSFTTLLPGSFAIPGFLEVGPVSPCHFFVGTEVT